MSARRPLAAILAAVALTVGAAPADAVNRWPTIRPHYGWLIVTARCESGLNWTAVSASGQYRGGLQFSVPTWRSVGGRGDPARASRMEQLYRGALLRARSGDGQWPRCGRHR